MPSVDEMQQAVTRMGETMRKYVAHASETLKNELFAEIQELKGQISAIPTPKDGVRGEKGEVGERGKDADETAIVLKLLAAFDEKFAALPAPKDGERGEKGEAGKDADEEKIFSNLCSELIKELDSRIPDISAIVRSEVVQAVSALPVPEKGDVGPAGKDFDPILAEELVAKAVSALPPPEKGEIGPPGRDFDPILAKELVQTEVAAAIAQLPPPKDGERGADGKSIDPLELADLVSERIAKQTEINEAKISAAVAKAVDEIPRSKDGERGEKGDKGADGKSIDPEEIKEFVRDEVTTAVGAIVKPENGKDGAKGDKGDRGEKGDSVDEAAVITKLSEKLDASVEILSKQALDRVEMAISAIPPPQKGDPGERGPQGKDADEEKIIRVALEAVDKKIEALPPAPAGKDAEPIHPDTIHRMVAEQVAAFIDKLEIKSGEHGRDAIAIEILPSIDPEKSYPRGTYAEYRNGVIRSVRNTDPITDSLEKAGWIVSMNGVFDETEEIKEDGRLLVRKTFYTNGKVFEREFRTAIVLDKGIWKQGTTYTAGDHVSWRGSGWIAQRETQLQPGESNVDTGWRLSAKRGNDGLSHDDSRNKGKHVVVRNK